MNKKKALKIFNNFKLDFETNKISNEKLLSKVKSYSEDVFGTESSEYENYKNFSFKVLVNDFESDESIKLKINNKDKDFKELLENSISKIEDGLIKRIEYPNFLSKIDNKSIIGIGIAVFITGVVLGRWLNEYEVLKFNDNNENHEQVEELKQ